MKRNSVDQLQRLVKTQKLIQSFRITKRYKKPNPNEYNNIKDIFIYSAYDRKDKLSVNSVSNNQINDFLKIKKTDLKIDIFTKTLFDSLVKNFVLWDNRLKKQLAKIINFFIHSKINFLKMKTILPQLLSTKKQIQVMKNKIIQSLKNYKTQQLNKVLQKFEKNDKKCQIIIKIISLLDKQQNQFINKFTIDNSSSIINDRQSNIQQINKLIKNYPKDRFKQQIIEKIQLILKSMQVNNQNLSNIDQIKNNSEIIQSEIQSQGLINKLQKLEEFNFTVKLQIDKIKEIDYFIECFYNNTSIAEDTKNRMKEYCIKLKERSTSVKQTTFKFLQCIVKESIYLLSQNISISKSLNQKSNYNADVISLLKKGCPNMCDNFKHQISPIIDNMESMYDKIESSLEDIKFFSKLPMLDTTKGLQAIKKVYQVCKQYKLRVKDLITKHYEICKLMRSECFRNEEEQTDKEIQFLKILSEFSIKCNCQAIKKAMKSPCFAAIKNQSMIQLQKQIRESQNNFNDIYRLYQNLFSMSQNNPIKQIIGSNIQFDTNLYFEAGILKQMIESAESVTEDSVLQTLKKIVEIYNLYKQNHSFSKKAQNFYERSVALTVSNAFSKESLQQIDDNNLIKFPKTEDQFQQLTHKFQHNRGVLQFIKDTYTCKKIKQVCQIYEEYTQFYITITNLKNNFHSLYFLQQKKIIEFVQTLFQKVFIRKQRNSQNSQLQTDVEKLIKVLNDRNSNLTKVIDDYQKGKIASMIRRQVSKLNKINDQLIMQLTQFRQLNSQNGKIEFYSIIVYSCVEYLHSTNQKCYYALLNGGQPFWISDFKDSTFGIMKTLGLKIYQRRFFQSDYTKFSAKINVQNGSKKIDKTKVRVFEELTESKSINIYEKFPKIKNLLQFNTFYRKKLILGKLFWRTIFENNDIENYFNNLGELKQANDYNQGLKQDLNNFILTNFDQFDSQMLESQQYYNVIKQIGEVANKNWDKLTELLKLTQKDYDILQHNHNILLISMHKQKRGLSVLNYLQQNFSHYCSLQDFDFNNYLRQCFHINKINHKKMKIIVYEIKQGCQLPINSDYNFVDQIMLMSRQFKVLKDGINLWNLTNRMWIEFLNISSETIISEMKVTDKLLKDLDRINNRNEIAHYIKSINAKSNICKATLYKHKKQFHSIIEMFNLDRNNILECIKNLDQLYRSNISDKYNLTIKNTRFPILLIDKDHLIQQQNQSFMGKLMLKGNSNNKNYTEHQLIDAINSLKISDQNSAYKCLKLFQIMHIRLTYLKKPIFIVKPTLNQLILAIIAYFTNIDYRSHQVLLQQFKKNLEINQTANITRVTIPVKAIGGFNNNTFSDCVFQNKQIRAQTRQLLSNEERDFCDFAWQQIHNNSQVNTSRNILKKLKNQLQILNDKAKSGSNDSIGRYIKSRQQQVKDFIQKNSDEINLLNKILKPNSNQNSIDRIQRISTKLDLIRQWMIDFLKFQRFKSYYLKTNNDNFLIYHSTSSAKQPLKIIERVLSILLQTKKQVVSDVLSKFISPFYSLVQDKVIIDYCKIIKKIKQSSNDNFVQKADLQLLIHKFNICHFINSNSQGLTALVKKLILAMQAEASIFPILKVLKESRAYLLEISSELEQLIEQVLQNRRSIESSQQFKQKISKLKAIDMNCLYTELPLQVLRQQQINRKSFNKFIQGAAAQYKVPLYKVLSSKNSFICYVPVMESQSMNRMFTELFLPKPSEYIAVSQEVLVTPLKLNTAKVTFSLGPDLKSQTLQYVIKNNFGFDQDDTFSLRMAIYQTYHKKQKELLYFGLPKEKQQINLHLNQFAVFFHLEVLFLQVDKNFIKQNHFQLSKHHKIEIMKQFDVGEGNVLLCQEIGKLIQKKSENIQMGKAKTDYKDSLYFIQQIQQVLKKNQLPITKISEQNIKTYLNSRHQLSQVQRLSDLIKIVYCNYVHKFRLNESKQSQNIQIDQQCTKNKIQSIKQFDPLQCFQSQIIDLSEQFYLPKPLKKLTSLTHLKWNHYKLIENLESNLCMSDFYSGYSIIIYIILNTYNNKQFTSD